MASSLEFAEYVCGQIAGAGVVTYKKMFGEYGIYCDGKFFALIIDNQFFVKATNAGRELASACEVLPPYEGAHPYFLIESLDDTVWLLDLVRTTCAELPFQKPRKK